MYIAPYFLTKHASSHMMKRVFLSSILLLWGKGQKWKKEEKSQVLFFKTSFGKY